MIFFVVNTYFEINFIPWHNIELKFMLNNFINRMRILCFSMAIERNVF